MSYMIDEGYTQQKKDQKKGGVVRAIALSLAFFVVGAAVAMGAMNVSVNARIDAAQEALQAQLDAANAQISALKTVNPNSTSYVTSVANLTGNTNADPGVAIAAACKPSIVGVTNQQYVSSNPYGGFFPYGGSQQQSDPTLEDYGFGSGVVISEEGLILTNHHVIDGADAVVVTLPDGTQVGASILGSDEYSDVALLKLDEQISGLMPAAIGDSDAIEVGEMAVAIGNPLGIELIGTMTMGVISAKDRQIELEDGTTMKTIQTDAAINSGNSGGGLFNAKGELIGITNMKMSSSGYSSSASIEGLGFAIPINIAMSIADEIMDTGTVARPTLGISARDLTEEEAAAYEGIEAGVLISRVQEDSPAQRAGLTPYDIITHFNGERITTFAQLKNALNQCRVGDTITLTIIRESASVDVTVELVYGTDL